MCTHKLLYVCDVVGVLLGHDGVQMMCRLNAGFWSHWPNQ